AVGRCGPDLRGGRRAPSAARGLACGSSGSRSARRRMGMRADSRVPSCTTGAVLALILAAHAP
ncbi:MAG: hypothetical protein WAL99_19380, partial [Pseudonocardiaceae bacterium]